MQLKLATLSVVFAAAMTASAASLDARQVPGGGVRATFYNEGGYCGNLANWVEDTYFTENLVGDCEDLTITNKFSATYFNESTITRPLRFYNAKCADRFGNQVNHFDVSSGNPTPGCVSQVILSYETI